MKGKRQSLIIEKSPHFAQSLGQHLTSEGYDVIGMTDSAREAIQLISIHHPDVITLALELEADHGLSVVTYLASHAQQFQTRSLVAVISNHLNHETVRAINRLLAPHPILVFYFDKGSTYSPEYFSTVLSVSEAYLSHQPHSPSHRFDDSISPNVHTHEWLDQLIRTKLSTYQLPDRSQNFEYLVFLIKEFTMDPPARNSMKVLYERSHHVFKVAPDSVETAMKRLKLHPSPKKFISLMAHQIRAEYAQQLFK